MDNIESKMHDITFNGMTHAMKVKSINTGRSSEFIKCLEM